MNILLISLNMEVIPDPVFPLGLACLSGALNESRHTHEILDLCFVDDFAAAIEKAVTELQPEAVGLSLRNVDNVAYPDSTSYLPFYRQVISHLRRLTPAPIILGGSGFSVMPESILEHLQADYGIYGEGERILIALLDQLDRGEPINGLPGVFCASPPVGRESPPSPGFLRLQELPMPCRDKFANDMYLHLGGMGNIQTKRGCGFNCIYCTYPLIEGRKVRLRPPAGVVEEMAHIHRQGISTFFIVDSVFNFPPQHAELICSEILKARLRVRWSCYMQPGFVTESLLQIMREAGCTSVDFGTDSGSDAVLPQTGKTFTGADVLRASELCHKVGMAFCHSLLFGGPGETPETVQETFDLMAEASPTAVIAMAGMRVYPGTKLAEIAPPDELIRTGGSMLAPTFYLARPVRNVLLDMLRAHAADNRNWILPGSNINIDRKLQEKLRRFGLKGPLWEHLDLRKKH